MLAPRRVPPWRIASVAALNTSMKETGPEATPRVEATRSPAGRRRLKAKPVPPPLIWIIAAHFTASKIPGMESSTGRTKQAESCPSSRPAFINVGEFGISSRRVMSRRNCSSARPGSRP
jgi:hypothetical protein